MSLSETQGSVLGSSDREKEAWSFRETSRSRRDAGDLMGARDALRRAAALSPKDQALWLELASVHRALGDRQEERRTLNHVLSVAPRNLAALLQAASLSEAEGDTRTAARLYTSALQSVPANARLDEGLQDALAHARVVAARGQVALEKALDARLAGLRAGVDRAALRRAERCAGHVLRRERVHRPQPSFLYFPNLPSIEFFDREDFPWLGELEAATDEIRDEFLAVCAEGEDTVEPYVRGVSDAAFQTLNESRRWGVVHLWRNGRRAEENAKRCPRTIGVLERVRPACAIRDTSPTAVFSILEPRTRIPPHTGVNNARVMVHLPLIVPPGCGFRVGLERREWVPGQAFVFDDTIEHEAWNDSDAPRAVLIFDIWNPFLSEVEREFVAALTETVADFYGPLPAGV